MDACHCANYEKQRVSTWKVGATIGRDNLQVSQYRAVVILTQTLVVDIRLVHFSKIVICSALRSLDRLE